MLEQVQKTAAEKGLQNIVTRQAAAEVLPFADGVFDIVLAASPPTIGRDFSAGLREARRVLKPGGLAMFIDTVAPASPVLDTHLQAIEPLRDAWHVRNFTVAEWVGGTGPGRVCSWKVFTPPPASGFRRLDRADKKPARAGGRHTPFAAERARKCENPSGHRPGWQFSRSAPPPSCCARAE